ncbi:hypothetical protein [Aporhodopirellula aestuarii]|uniref:Uncharacterized protein n=1 Tax=Aporhodopirellula aestuarii TaxID=2950107 RepID=A0ABT0U2F7_9BACT|nr:hypothetical protein [Aporhodopirellula aestuarii]MCM2370839.1 hypothetical protein [Aporhodopirellula aestuarii]
MRLAIEQDSPTMWLIAIDEAGYGPKLGPLVVAATAWHLDDASPGAKSQINHDVSSDQITPDPFLNVASPIRVGNATIRVDDSKNIFRGGSLSTLHAIFSVANHARGRSDATLADCLPTLLPLDHESILDIAWLKTTSGPASKPIELVPIAQARAAVDQWNRCEWKLRDVAARMIDAGAFNQFCSGNGSNILPRGNKSDLLGETSLRLAVDLLDRATASTVTPAKATKRRTGAKPSQRKTTPPEPVQIFFDRHGGRRYYAGMIQEIFGGGPVRILSESKTQSVYETVRDNRNVRLHFTVKGDRFVPVALSSLHAKYLRELAMASFNAYFREAMQVASASPSTKKTEATEFRPTAGYPVDADRFIDMIRPVMKANGITDAELIRCR